MPARALRVLVNGIPLHAPRTGVGRLLTRLARDLSELDPGTEVTFFDGLRARPHWVGNSTGGRAPAGELRRRLVHAALRARLYLPVQDRLFAASRHEARFDLYHETNFLLPPFQGPIVASVWDLSLRFHPRAHPAGRVRLFEDAFVRRVHRVSRFVVLSRSVRDELCDELEIAPERVTIAPPGVDGAVFHPGPSGASPLRLPALPSRFLLSVGTIEPRKNLPVLLAAHRLLPRTLRRELGLVVAGPLGWDHGPLLGQLRSAASRGDLVRFGYLPDPVLAELYRRAEALVYPTLYEGFGLPVLEAMACGTPVVCSDIPALAELTGEAALRAPPGDPEALASCLRTLLEDDEMAARLTAGGLRRAAGYSWERHAGQILAAYREARVG